MGDWFREILERRYPKPRAKFGILDYLFFAGLAAVQSVVLFFGLFGFILYYNLYLYGLVGRKR